jgi:hypothetical protein
VLEQHAVNPWEEAGKAVGEKLAKTIPGGKEEALSLRGKNAILISGAESQQAAGAAIRGAEALIWRVSGKNARALLRQLFADFEWDSAGGKNLQERSSLD